MEHKTLAIVPAAGYGHRLKLKAKKPYVLLGGKPLIIYSLRALEDSRYIDGIIVAAERPCISMMNRIISRYGLKKVIRVIAGGKTRYESVKNCLKVAGDRFDIALIHDGARPFLDDSLIKNSVRLARIYGGCVTALPESDTVKLADARMFVDKTLDRSKIYRAQTPQAFRMELIKKAYLQDRQVFATDDSMLMELAGQRVKILEGYPGNIKITTREDLKMAEVLL